jgi:recombinational DNA repair ATPase RecF
MSFKVKRIKMQNFINFSDFEIEFNGQVSHLVGVNGSGKTSVGLISILAAFKGIAERSKIGQITGERYKFIGPNGKSSDVAVTIIDTEQNDAEIVVRNHITSASNAIVFEAPEGYDLNHERFSNILSLAFLSSKNFTSLSGKEQAIALGIDTSTFDKEIKGIKDEYTLINRDFRNFGELEEVEKIEKVHIGKVLEERQVIIDFNNEQDKIKGSLEIYKKFLDQLNSEKEELVRKLKQTEENILEVTLNMAHSPKAEEHKSLDKVNEKITNVEVTNEKALAYDSYVSKKELKDAKSKELATNRDSLAKKEEKRLEYIQSFQMPFKNLTVDEDGQLLLKDRPIKPEYFSTGELILIVAKLHMAKNPEFRTTFIDDFELLDEDNQKEILTKLTELDFQVIVAEVGKMKKGENSFLLRESKIVNSY